MLTSSVKSEVADAPVLAISMECLSLKITYCLQQMKGFCCYFIGILSRQSQLLLSCAKPAEAPRLFGSPCDVCCGDLRQAWAIPVGV